MCLFIVNALDEAWLKALDVDTSEDALMKLNVAMIDEVAKVISEFMKDYKANYADKEEEDPSVLFVIDSLGMMLTLLTLTVKKGDMKGDLGRVPRHLLHL